MDRQGTGHSSITLHSALLDGELPGTVPHPEPRAATKRLEALATGLHETCTITEVYRIQQPEVVHAALEDAQAGQQYLRFKDKGDPSQSHWKGPNQLLLIETQDELLLCALDWPLQG